MKTSDPFAAFHASYTHTLTDGNEYRLICSPNCEIEKLMDRRPIRAEL